MSNEKIRQLLAELQAELERMDVDDDTRAQVDALEQDIRDSVSADEQDGQQDNALLERAKQLETRFAAKHPTAELFLREIADALGKLGI
ncbi:MAG: DUF4404 family protein [Pseudomonadales bacterium]|nr:DUF4404 family protein [Pseudomonadales bacterium]